MQVMRLWSSLPGSATSSSSLDQLDLQSSALQDFDATQDVVWMAEVAEESTLTWSAKQRIARVLNRHAPLSRSCARAACRFLYTQLDDADNQGTLALELRRTIAQLKPLGLILTLPATGACYRACARWQRSISYLWTYAMTPTSLAPCASLQPTPKAQAAAPRVLVSRATPEAASDGRQRPRGRAVEL